MPAAAGPHPLAAQRSGRTAAHVPGVNYLGGRLPNCRRAVHGSAVDRIAGLAGQFQMGLGFLGAAPKLELDG